MAGKIIVTAPHEYMGVMKLYIYIDNVEQKVTLKRGEHHEFIISKNSFIFGKVSRVNSKEHLALSEHVTEIQFIYKQFAGKLEMQIVSQTPINEYEEMEIEKPVFDFDGGKGDKLTVYDDRIVIKHKGVLNVMAMGVHGDKTIYYSDLTAIQYKPGGLLAGHLQFSILGGNEGRGGVLNAASDENTITFSADKNGEAKKVYEYLNNKLREAKTIKNTPIVQVAPTVSAADELKKFKELLDMGAITQEEFEAKKKQLLGL